MTRTARVEPSVTGLRKIQLLEGVPQPALESLARQCRWRRYRADERIISREAPDSDVYLIVGGRVRVTAFSGGGRQITYTDMATGQWFGDFAAIDGHSRSADVVALEETLLAALTPGMFLELLREHPVVNECMLRRLARSVRELTDRVYDLTTLGVQNRVHAELLRLAKAAGVSNNVSRIDPAPRHTDLAANISTYREQVTREISAMVKQGLVERCGNALVIPDVGRLEEIVADVRRSL
jgi:CRP-like cAMP-binding protein